MADPLDAGYRSAQGRIDAATQAKMIILWRLLNVNDVSGTQDRWMTYALAVLRVQYILSTRLASDYFTGRRALDLPGAAPFELRLPTLNEDAARASLRAMGPAKIVAAQNKLTLLAGEPTPAAPAARPEVILPPQMLRTIQQAQAASAQRIVHNGARDTIGNAYEDDPTAVGYVRVTSAKPCYFCALLASRGPVYRGDSFAESDARFYGPGNAKCHDGCHCDLRPLYRRVPPAEDQKAWDDIYRTSLGERQPGESPLNAFRRLYDAQAAR